MKKIGEGKDRIVYSFGKEYVLKLAKIDFKKLKYFLRKEKFSLKDTLKLSSGIISNLQEYKNSKITDKIAKVKLTIFGLINIQEKYKLAEGIYKKNFFDTESFSQIMSELKVLIDDENLKKQNKREYSLLMHFIDNLKNYGVDKDGELILLDGGNELIGNLLKEKGNEIFDILFKKNN